MQQEYNIPEDFNLQANNTFLLQATQFNLVWLVSAMCQMKKLGECRLPI